MADATHPSRSRAIGMLLLANFFWGLSFPLIKAIVFLQRQMLPAGATWFSAVYTVAPRFVLGLALMLALRPGECWPLTRKEIKQGIVIGGFAAAGMLFQNDGLQFTAASTSAFLTQFYAILIPAWLAWRRRRAPEGIVWVCCALVLLGVGILGRFNWTDLRFGRGEGETLLCSLFFMGQILYLEKPEFAANRPWRLTLVTFTTQAVIFWLLAFLTAPSKAALLQPWTSEPWLALVALLTVFCTVGAYSLMNAWQPKISSTEAGLLYCAEPVFASLMAAFLPGWFSAWCGIDYPNERATWTLLVGGGLITLANILLQFRRRERD